MAELQLVWAFGVGAIFGAALVYADTRQPVAENPHRECGRCGRPPTAEGHDAYLGTLPGVMNACCGHGQANEAYVQREDGSSYSGEAAIAFQARESVPAGGDDG